MGKIRQGNFYLIATEPQPTKVILTLVEKPEWNGVNPDRRAKMSLLAFTTFGLHRLTNPILVSDTENITPDELNQMLGNCLNFEVSDCQGNLQNV